MADDEVWFEPKRFGYGAGLPVAWQGWALLVAFFAVLGAAGVLLMPRHPLAFVAIAVIAATGLTTVAARHTRGGFRWRWSSRG